MSTLIEVNGVVKAYGGIKALDGCELEVREGEINGLIGPNGSGKTTLFNVITGYERVQQGKVTFGGRDITNAAPDRVFGLGIGRTFQLTRMFPRLTVLENMLVATQREEGWLRSVTRLAGSHAERVASDRAARLRRHHAARARAGGEPLLRSAQAAGARLAAGRRSGRSCCSTSPPAVSTRR